MDDWAIELSDVVKRYGQLTAVAGLSLRVPRGQCVGLLGPNGAGKTTTLEMLEGLLRPDSGSIRILGRTWASDEAWLKTKIGLSLQETRFDGYLTVLETVELFRSFSKEGLTARQALDRVGLWDRRKQRVEGLSGGQRQRLALAVGIVGDPEVLFLDEPTTGLDPHARRALWEIIQRLKSAGTTIVLTTHYMDEVEQLSDRIVVLDRGRVIADGTAAELRAAYGGHHVIELLADPPLDAEAARSLPGVSRLTEAGGKLLLGVEDVRLTLPAALERCAADARKVLQLSVRLPSLDDVFIDLTGRSLEEGSRSEAP